LAATLPAFSLAGAFSIIRFRSVPGDPKDIAYVLFALAAGLACGMGYLTFGFLFTLVVCLVMLILNAIKFGQGKTTGKLLKVMIPETSTMKMPSKMYSTSTPCPMIWSK